MEAFIDEIYQKAVAEQYFRQALHGAQTRDFILKYNGWTCGAAILEAWLEESGADHSELTEGIFRSAEEARNCFSDDARFALVLEDKLIPLVTTLLDPYTGIDAEENGWRLESSSTGFLTVSSVKTGKYIYSSKSPMWEAWLQARRFFEPKQKQYAIFGGGLGYLAYQLWSVSDNTAHIYIYAPDPQLCLFAKRYGVLDWIGPDHLHIVIDESEDVVAEKFLNDTKGMRKIMTEPPEYYYQGKHLSTLKYQFQNFGMVGEFEKTRLINIENNLGRGVSMKELALPRKKEWIVVAAGPSLKDNMDFIRESQGKRTIVSISAALKNLLNHDIKPDLSVAADPFLMQISHISGIEDETSVIPLVSNYHANCQFLQSYRGDVFFTATEEDMLNYDLQEYDPVVLQYGGTVSSMALAIAYYYGAEKIYLVGLDLGYSEGKNYASGGAYDEGGGLEGTHKVDSVDGGKVGTNDTFDSFRYFIEYQIRINPGVKVVNLSKHGALIHGAESENA